MIKYILLAVMSLYSVMTQAAEITIDVGDASGMIVCVNSTGEYTIAKTGSGPTAITLLNGYAWGCRYGNKQAFYDLSMPAIGMVGGVEVLIDFDANFFTVKNGD